MSGFGSGRFDLRALPEDPTTRLERALDGIASMVRGMQDGDSVLLERKSGTGAEPFFTVTFTRERVTHGRHCPCSACAAEDWTNPTLAACGMHGPTCPREYAPISR